MEKKMCCSAAEQQEAPSACLCWVYFHFWSETAEIISERANLQQTETGAELTYGGFRGQMFSHCRTEYVQLVISFLQVHLILYFYSLFIFLYPVSLLYWAH